ncbi:MAG: polyprenyl synthetase family protein [Bdellovibrionaceae bacterium]|nr:polyprenyl synthetase family protein [Pseudobdellovibrionaceae bacterium]MBX3034078.1 polyprenyl synthetase family protein [Pseudobdellovibrionaceae bacterium]
MNFETEIGRRADEVSAFLRAWFAEFGPERGNAIGRLADSMAYSALGPGKRFRPVLSLLVGESLGIPAIKIMPWAAAVEMVHTYSLIHDDLPCMDDDDERRGRPTNHRAFDEATALLAGDALLTEAFGLIGDAYSGAGATAGRLVVLLAHCAGARGMVGGQALDLAAEAASAQREIPLADLRRIHELKTGRLIRASTEGAAIAAGAAENGVRAFRAFGEKLGLAFQIADDILDAHEEGQDGRSFVQHLGVEGARRELAGVSEEARALLIGIPAASPLLVKMIDWNLDRRA